MWFFIIGAALTLAGSLQQANAQRQAGSAEYLAGLYEQTLAGRRAQAMEQEAGQYRAASQRAAIEERRQGKIAQSRARALAGASGAAVSDPTMAKVMGDIGYEGELRALTAIYQGEEAARGMEYQAEMERAAGRGALYSGTVSRELSKAKGASTLLGGAGQAFGMFGKYA